jgi:AcrR family transcriptional regulator
MAGQGSGGGQPVLAFRGARPATAQAPDARRGQPRAGTAAAIKEAARDLLATGGQAALTLRGVARAVGISASAIYRYYPSLDSLAAALRADICAELITFVESVRDSIREDDPVGRMKWITLAFRGWALDRRAEYLLLAWPGPESKLAKVSGQKSDPYDQIGILFLDVCAEVWLRQQARSTAKAPSRVAFDRPLSPWLSERYVKLPTDVICASWITWMKLSGLILMEATGYLARVRADSQALLEAEVADHVARLAA